MPADMRNAGQYKACCRTISLPTKCVTVGQYLAIRASPSAVPDPNPSGNFTKITQRLPVRIALTDKDAALRPGMMVEVDIDLARH